ncbi:SANT and BTB domain regulator of class switch recombination-like, partial [Saccoglossus kowalevskii]
LTEVNVYSSEEYVCGLVEDTGSMHVLQRSLFPDDSKSAVSFIHIAMDISSFSVSRHKWDSMRSLRWNQDAQREEDSRRMSELISYLTKLRSANEKQDKSRSKEHPGGIFCRIDAQFRSSQQMSKPNSSGMMGQARSKTRTGMVRLT